MRVQRHPHGVAQPPAAARDEDLGQGIAETVEHGEHDDGRREQRDRADPGRGDPREPERGPLIPEEVDQVTDGVGLEHRSNGFGGKHEKREDEPSPLARAEP